MRRHDARTPLPRHRPRRAPLLAATLAVTMSLGCASSPSSAPEPTPATVVTTPVGSPTRPATAYAEATDPTRRQRLRALAVLRAWDARRASAYELADPVRLRGLYAEGSTAGRRDVRLLRAYAAGGVAVTDLEEQVDRVRLLRRGSRALTLEVRGRTLARVRVAGAPRAPVAEKALPAGPCLTRRITFVRVRPGHWVVRAVRPAPRRPAR